MSDTADTGYRVPTPHGEFPVERRNTVAITLWRVRESWPAGQITLYGGVKIAGTITHTHHRLLAHAHRAVHNPKPWGDYIGTFDLNGEPIEQEPAKPSAKGHTRCPHCGKPL